MPPKKWKAEELVDRVRAKYGDEGRASVVIEQLASGVGARATSWIDAASFDLWPSKGLTRRAFEIKVARGDFLRELQNPAKNAWARECFHEFWYVAPPEVIKEEELPEGCGWLKPRGSGLGIARHASRRENPTLDEFLLAAICRGAQQEIGRRKKGLRDEIHETDPNYLEAMIWKRAAQKFITERTGQHHYVFEEDDNAEEELLAKLRSATVSAELKESRNQFFALVRRFQGDMLTLFASFAALAHVSLEKRDQVGESIVGAWGSVDDSSMAELLKRAGKGKHERATITKTLELLQQIHRIGGGE